MTLLKIRETGRHRGRRDRVQLAAGYARGGPDNSALGVRGIRGRFYDALESAPRAWVKEIGLWFPDSDQLTEDHRWLGAPPKPREHVGGLQAQPINDYAQQVTNRDFEATLPFSIHDLRRDKTGQFPRKVSEFSEGIEDHWNDLGVETIENNANCYDGQALFSASHTGSSGTQSNLLTSTDLSSLNVIDPTRPTKDECGRILADVANYFFLYLDDQGRPTNQTARRFMVVAHPSICPGFREAIRAQFYSQGGSNDAMAHDFDYVLVPEPRLSTPSSFYMFRADASASFLIVQEEVAPELHYLGPDSEHAVKNSEVLWIIKFTRAVGEGQWRHGAKATLD